MGHGAATGGHLLPGSAGTRGVRERRGSPGRWGERRRRGGAPEPGGPRAPQAGPAPGSRAPARPAPAEAARRPQAGPPRRTRVRAGAARRSGSAVHRCPACGLTLMPAPRSPAGRSRHHAEGECAVAPAARGGRWPVCWGGGREGVPGTRSRPPPPAGEPSRAGGAESGGRGGVGAPGAAASPPPRASARTPCRGANTSGRTARAALGPKGVVPRHPRLRFLGEPLRRPPHARSAFSQLRSARRRSLLGSLLNFAPGVGWAPGRPPREAGIGPSPGKGGRRPCGCVSGRWPAGFA